MKSPSRWRLDAAPMWLGSAIAHLLALVALTLVVMAPMVRPPDADLVSRLEDIDEPLVVERLGLPIAPSAEPTTLDTLAPEWEKETLSLEIAEAASPTPAPPSLAEPPSPDLADLSVEQPGISLEAGAEGKNGGGFFSSREPKMKRALLGSEGATRQSEFAVQTGLDWLARHQYADGHWSIDHRPRARGPTSGQGKVHSNMAATALGVLPFLGANYTPIAGPKEYREPVQRAILWMIQRQQPSGYLLAAGDDPESGMYTHGVATIALCEAYALTRQQNIRVAAQKAVEFILKTQNRVGAWRYKPDSTDADTSVLGWQVMALRSAEASGLLDSRPQKAALADSRKRYRAFLETVAIGEHKGIFNYRKGEEGSDGNNTTTSIGLLTLQYAGARSSDARMKEGLDFLIARRPPNDPKQTKYRNSYFWYYGTLVIHNVGGKYWDDWNRAVRANLVETQNRVKGDTDHGSWDPFLPLPDFWAKEGGRHLVTTMGILTLEAYYRFLPLYRELAKGADES